MKTKPILFSGPMVRAILAGRKTQTRRVVKDAPTGNYLPIHFHGKGNCGFANMDLANPYDERIDAKPKYEKGDVLHVRETTRIGAWNDEEHKIAFDYRASPELKKTPWVQFEDLDRFSELHIKAIDELGKLGFEPIVDEENERFYYRWEPGCSPLKWKPSIFMPREAARIFLEVTDVRAERLQDISEEDAIAEGVEVIGNAIGTPQYRDYLNRNGDHSAGGWPVISFQSLWEYINGAGSWETNPWVWVYSFKRIEKPATT